MHTLKRIVLGFLGAAAWAAIASTSTPTLAQSGAVSIASNQWNTFVADVTVSAARVKADGTKAAVSTAPMRYRWERSQFGAGWKTVMTIQTVAVIAGAREGSRSVENPFAIARIEDDEDGSPLRIYARSGARIQKPSLQSLQEWTGARPGRFFGAPMFREVHLRTEIGSSLAPRAPVANTNRDWIGAFVATPQQLPERRNRLAQQFVRAGNILGLDRYIRVEGVKTHEVLVDPQSAVPIEINMLTDSQLVSHSRITYQPSADGSLVRRSVHVEQVLSAAADERAVTDTEYANVRVEQRR